MNEERVRRVFDQIKLPPEQRQAMLDRLLQTQREERTMKRMKKLIVVGIAAALMVTACAAAVVTGLDRRLADYFGAGPEQVELLAPGQNFYLRYDTSSGSLDQGGISLRAGSGGEYWRGDGNGCTIYVGTTSGDLTLYEA